MTRPSTLLCGACALILVTAAGCRADGPLPPPDVILTSGLVLSAEPASLVIRPGSSGRVRCRVTDQANQPVASYPVTFAIVSESDAGDGVDATLSAANGLTGDDGEAVVEVIVGALARNDRPAAFSVVVTSPGAPEKQTDVLVTTNAFSVEIFPVPEDSLLGSASVVATRLYFYDNSACADLDVHNLGATLDQARAPHTIAINSSYIFSGVAASGVHAVIGLGLDSTGTTQIGGCVDVPGVALLDTETVRAVLFLDNLFPTPLGTYTVASDFHLTPAPTALAPLASAWQQWARCPFDPARLWLDCTIAALDTNPGTPSCVPVAGAVGPLGDLLLAARGTVVPPLSAALVGASDTPCHGATDSSGNPSLEASVDALFSGTRGQLTGARLGAFPSELAALLDDIRISSQMTFSRAGDVNRYWVEHDLLGVSFPDALSPVSFDTQALGLPVPSASGILASFEAGQVYLPSHGFTLRLGTSARYAFEATSLTARGVSDSAKLAKAIFQLAQSSGQPGVLVGCAALDAVACDRINQARGCVIDACQAGVVALGQSLASAFQQLDGSGLDFILSGSAPLLDLNADGRADALGMTSPASSAIAGSGIWAAEILSRAGGYVTYGSWLATRAASAP